MTLDFSYAIKKLKDIEQSFNNADSATQRYALLEALNHLADNDIRFNDEYWLKTWRDAMLREQGVEVKS